MALRSCVNCRAPRQDQSRLPTCPRCRGLAHDQRMAQRRTQRQAPPEGLTLLQAALPPSLAILGGVHTFRVEYVAQDRGWGVKAHGRYVAVCATEPEALRWLAGLLLKLSCVPLHAPATT